MPDFVHALPLGRHVRHDERSREYPALRSSALVTTEHQRFTPILDQLELGSCTGNALVGALGCEPLYRAGLGHLDEPLAIRIYSEATHLDRVRGIYPPDDTGSSGLAVAKAAQRDGLIGAYRHAFGLAHALGALVVAPVIIGIPWYDSFDRPPSSGILSISPNAVVRGGHEVVLRVINVEAGEVGGDNSWSSQWGPLGGRFRMTWSTFGRLLHEQGDVTQLVA